MGILQTPQEGGTLEEEVSRPSFPSGETVQ